ncbi:MAG: hypothetical protein EOM05_07180 [Clostridia bacterium]|nr:hypothetical protein [Clostridia bacterium]
MKKTLFFIVALSLLVFACGPVETSETAQKYHQELIDSQTTVDNAFVDLMDAMDWGVEAEILDAKDVAETTLEKAIGEIEAMDDFDGKDEYKAEMLKLLDMYKDILENELSEMIDYIIYFEDMTDEEWDYYYSLSDSMLDKYEKAHDEFATYQDEFAEEWEFTLI